MFQVFTLTKSFTKQKQMVLLLSFPQLMPAEIMLLYSTFELEQKNERTQISAV